MRRRDLLKLGAGALAAPAIARAQGSKVLRLIPQSDLAVLDPIWTSAYVTRNHGFMVFDTLFGVDDSFRARPQMVAGSVREDEGKVWKLGLRAGLKFHDGTPVLARDCVASIQRWGKRDSFGQALMAATDELSASDDETIVFRLKHPFALLPDALGKAGANMCAIMPERLALTDAFKPITEMVGSGPFRFKADERVSGARVVYERFKDYVPRPDGVPQCTAGPKIVNFDRVEWNVIPDAATAAAAMQRGEADWWERLDFDLMDMLARDPNLVVKVIETTGNIGIMRFNTLFPPFDKPAVRHALLGAVNQQDFVSAVAGDHPASVRTDVGMFTPGMPMTDGKNIPVLTGDRDYAKVKADLAAAGYHGEKVVFMVASDFPSLAAYGRVAADMLRRAGMNVDQQEADWGTVVQRRASKSPPDKGGWSAFCTTYTGMDMASPADNSLLRGNGANAWFGWPTIPEEESLRESWLEAPDLAAQQAVAAKMQAVGFEQAPFLPLGMVFLPSLLNKSLSGVLSGLPIFWNVKKG
jgi:peptide/nickel transport system substrate-binding protein